MNTEYERELSRSFKTVLKEGGALYNGSGRLAETYARLAAKLQELGLGYSLAGGYALILHGVRRFTEDIDLLVTEETVSAIQKSLVGLGYTAIPGSDRNIRDAETGVRIEFICTGQFPGDGKEKPVAFPDPSEASEEIDGIQVVTMKTLIELKLASGMTSKDRLQDLADVQRLIQTHTLSREYAEELHPYVRDAFLDLCPD